jgi:GNAT superfamily N-acetyltransferase
VALIAPAKPGDIEAISVLLQELDRFYGYAETGPLEARVLQIKDALFGDPPVAYALLAWDEGQLVGLASYSFLWPVMGLTRSLFLKELYVSDSARRTGIGRQLMNGLFSIAVKRGCSRVEWHTDRFNTNAQRFYELLGVQPHPSKIFYRLGGDGLLHAAEF